MNLKSMVLFPTKRLPEALEAAQTAVALDPNAAYGYYAMGQAECAGRPAGSRWCKSITMKK
jgi:hypothetical protein